jgi:hypothetical protein
LSYFDRRGCAPVSPRRPGERITGDVPWCAVKRLDGKGGFSMREMFTMWRHTNMVVLTALSAAIYAALLIPFQSIPIMGHGGRRSGT